MRLEYPVGALLLLVVAGCIGNNINRIGAGTGDEGAGSYQDPDTDVDAGEGTDSDTPAGTDVDPGGDADIDLGADTDGEAEITIQENEAGFCSLDGTIDSNHGGYTGSGFANPENVAGSGIEWSLEAYSATPVQVEWTYALGGDTSRPGAVHVNGIATVPFLDFPGTGGWESWSAVETSLLLAEGSNTLRLEATTGNGLANIDAVTIRGAGISTGECTTDMDPDTGTDPTGSTTLWIAGDSTVATSGGTPCPRGWGGVFGVLFNDTVTVANRAVGGRSVRTWLYRVTSEMGTDGECITETDAEGAPIYQDRWVEMQGNMSSGDTLFIQFGINDGSPTCDRHVGETQFQLEYGMMAEAARAAGAYPVFLTPVSMIRCSGSTAVGSRGFLDATYQAGGDYGVPVIDLHQLSVDLYNELGFCPLPDGYTDINASTPGEVGAFFCEDHTHFDTPGAEAIARVIADAIRDLELPLAARLQ